MMKNLVIIIKIYILRSIIIQISFFFYVNLIKLDFIIKSNQQVLYTMICDCLPVIFICFKWKSNTYQEI